MVKLENLQPNAALRGILPDALVSLRCPLAIEKAVRSSSACGVPCIGRPKGISIRYNSAEACYG